MEDTTVEKLILGQLNKLTDECAKDCVLSIFLRKNESLASVISRYWCAYFVIKAALLKFGRFTDSRTELFDPLQKGSNTWEDVLELATTEFWKRNSIQTLLIHKCADQKNELEQKNLVSQLLTTVEIELPTYIEIYRQAGKSESECSVLARLAEIDSDEFFKNIVSEADRDPNVKYRFLKEVHTRLGIHSNIVLFTDVIPQAIKEELTKNIPHKTIKFAVVESTQNLESILTEAGFNSDIIRSLLDQELDLEMFDEYDTNTLKQDLMAYGMKLGPVNKVIKFQEIRKSSHK
jgi:hypothetical protein